MSFTTTNLRNLQENHYSTRNATLPYEMAHEITNLVLGAYTRDIVAHHVNSDDTGAWDAVLTLLHISSAFRAATMDIITRLTRPTAPADPSNAARCLPTLRYLKAQAASGPTRDTFDPYLSFDLVGPLGDIRWLSDPLSNILSLSVLVRDRTDRVSDPEALTNAAAAALLAEYLALPRTVRDAVRPVVRETYAAVFLCNKLSALSRASHAIVTYASHAVAAREAAHTFPQVIVESAEAGLRIAQGHADAMLALSAGDRYPFGEDEHPYIYPQTLSALHFDDALRVLNNWPGEQEMQVDLACRTWKRALRLLLTEKERALYMGKDGEEDGEDQPNTIHAGECARL